MFEAERQFLREWSLLRSLISSDRSFRERLASAESWLVRASEIGAQVGDAALLARCKERSEMIVAARVGGGLAMVHSLANTTLPLFL